MMFPPKVLRSASTTKYSSNSSSTSSKFFIKGTVRVVLSDLLCKDINARFTTVPLKTLYELYLHVFA